MKKDLLAILILLILGYWSVRPVFNLGFFPMHDDTQVGRVVAMGRALRNGQFPVRWVSELGYGYGYPIFNFYGPLPYYVGGVFYAIGLSGLTATKAMFVLGIMLAAISMYLVSSRIFGRLAAVLAGLFYLYAPYHALDIYVRGAVGEFWALVFLPLIFWGSWQVQFGQRAQAVIIGGIGLAGVVLSHTILGYVTVIFYLIGFMLWALIQLLVKRLDRDAFVGEVLIFVIGLGLSAFFWLPARSEMQFTNVASQMGGGADFHDHFVCLGQLWNSSWGFGGSTKGCLDGFSFRLGKLHLLLGAAALALWFPLRRRFKQVSAVVLATATTSVSIFLMLRTSQPIWEAIPNFAYVQYPWRLLAFTILGLSILVGSLTAAIRATPLRWGLATVLVILLLIFNAKLFMPQYTYTRTDADFESDLELRWRVSKISDEYLPPDLVRPNLPAEINSQVLSGTGQLTVDTQIDTETYLKFELSSDKESDLTIRRAYFPGWHYFLNGREIAAQVQSGLPHVYLPSGQSVLEMRFTDTPVRTVGNIISLLTVVVLLVRYGKKTYT